MFDSMTLDASPLFSTKCSDSPTAALARLEFAHTFVQHLQRDGFAQLRNFGIDTSMIEEMFKHVKLPISRFAILTYLYRVYIAQSLL